MDRDEFKAKTYEIVAKSATIFAVFMVLRFVFDSSNPLLSGLSMACATVLVVILDFVLVQKQYWRRK